MKKRYVLIIIIIAISVSGVLIWRFRKLSALKVIPLDAASISRVLASAMITDLKSGKSSLYYLDDSERYDEEVKEILKILDSSGYRRDFRDLRPWGVRSVSSDKNYDGRVLRIFFSDGSHAAELDFMSSSLLTVMADGKTTRVYHPLNQNTFNELIEYVQTNGAEH